MTKVACRARAIAALGIALSGAGTLAGAVPTAAQSHLMPNPFVDTSDSSYLKPSAQYLEIYDALRGRHVLEELRDFLHPLHLPRELPIVTRECGATSLPYVSGQPVTLCYELVAQMQAAAQKIYPQDARKQADTVIGGFIQAALTQTALALFDILKIPVWGRLEDASDALAALIMTQFGEDMQHVTMFASTDLLEYSASVGKPWVGTDFANPDSPDAQRDYTYLCISAAADPVNYGGWLTITDDRGTVVHKGVIPAYRSQYCQREYDTIRKAFDLRIMPYVDPVELIEIRATDWLAWKPHQ